MAPRSDRWAIGVVVVGSIGVFVVSLLSVLAVIFPVVLVGMTATAAVVSTVMLTTAWGLSPRLTRPIQASAVFSMTATVLLAFVRP